MSHAHAYCGHCRVKTDQIRLQAPSIPHHLWSWMCCACKNRAFEWELALVRWFARALDPRRFEWRVHPDNYERAQRRMAKRGIKLVADPTCPTGGVYEMEVERKPRAKASVP